MGGESVKSCEEDLMGCEERGNEGRLASCLGELCWQGKLREGTRSIPWREECEGVFDDEQKMSYSQTFSERGMARGRQ